MAAGNSYGFVDYLQKVFEDAENNYGTTPNTIMCALIKSASNGGWDPSVTDPYPTWGAGGTTDLSSYEVTPGGEYSAGGVACATPGTTVLSNALKIDWANPPTWAQHASNPTDARWAIFYDLSTTNNDCVLWYDLGTDINMTSGELSITMGDPAYTFTVTTP